MATLTRAERLDRILSAVAPGTVAYHTKTGSWPVRPGIDGRDEAQAPYVIQTTHGGGRRVRVFSDDGDVFAGQGVTLDVAIAALETKLKLAAVDPAQEASDGQ